MGFALASKVDFSSPDVSRIVNSIAGHAVRKFGLNDHDFEDLRQDSFVRLIATDDYDPARGRVSTWAFSRCRDLPRKIVREAIRRPSPIIHEDGNEVSELARTDSRLSDYMTGNAFVDSVILALSEGKSRKEIASSLGVTVHRVKETIARIKKGIE